MIAKIIQYDGLFGRSPRPATIDRNVLSISYSLAKYVADLELDETDLHNLREAGRVGEYVQDDRANSDRIQDRHTCNLASKSWGDRAQEWAYLVAAHGEKALRHLVVSYNDDSITTDIARKHQEVFQRVMRAQNYPVIFSTHGDTKNPHWHAALCLHDVKENKRGNWGQQYEIEACHIALAICVFDDRLKCEPNRRYVADETGVYHTWSGKKVADREGTLDNTGGLQLIHSLQIAFDKSNAAPDGAKVGDPLPMHLAIERTARGIVKESNSWEDFHRGLARCGLRYETYTAAGEIRGGHIVVQNPDDPRDDRLNGSHCNAGYKRLVKKYGGQAFAPAPTDLWVRPFVVPTYSSKSGDDASVDLAEKKRVAIDEALTGELSQRLKSQHQQQRDLATKATPATEQSKREQDKRRKKAASQLKKEHDEEKLHILGLKKAIKNNRPKRSPGRPSTAEPVEAVIWGMAPIDRGPNVGTNQQEQDPWRSKYSISASTVPRDYRLGSDVAFRETRNFVVLKKLDKQSQIDALLLAQEKFGTIRVHGTREQRKVLIAMAAELGIPLDRSQRVQGAAHLARVSLGKASSLIKPKAPNQGAKPTKRSSAADRVDGDIIYETPSRSGVGNPAMASTPEADNEVGPISEHRGMRSRPRGEDRSRLYYDQIEIEDYLARTRESPDDYKIDGNESIVVAHSDRTDFSIPDLEYATDEQHAELLLRYQLQEKELAVLKSSVTKIFEESGHRAELDVEVWDLSEADCDVASRRIQTHLGKEIVRQLRHAFAERARASRANDSLGGQSNPSENVNARQPQNRLTAKVRESPGQRRFPTDDKSIE